MSELSWKYRAMIYFAHSTLVLYKKTIECDREMSVKFFMEVNKDVVQRVCDEAISVFNYELSYEQICRACAVYLNAEFCPQSVHDTTVYKLNPARLGQ